MRNIFFRLITAIAFVTITGNAVADGRLVQLKTRPDVTQSIFVIKPDKPAASVVLLPGGKGVINLGPDGPENGGNFLVRSRDLFAGNNLMVAVVDAASDFASSEDGLASQRTGKEHMQDLEEIIKHLRKEANVPVWLVGTSRGTISAAAFASQKPEGANGIVLTASVSESGKGKPDSVMSSDLSKITTSVLLVHHKKDDCYVSPYSGVEKIKKKLVNSRKVEVLAFDGGAAKQKNGCKPKTYHGFFEIEDEVVGKISDWIKSH